MKIKDYLIKHSMSKRDFATMIGIPASTLEKYIYSKRTPGLVIAYHIVLRTNGAIQYEDLLPDNIKIEKFINNKVDKWNEL